MFEGGNVHVVIFLTADADGLEHMSDRGKQHVENRPTYVPKSQFTKSLNISSACSIDSCGILNGNRIVTTDRRRA